MKWWRTEPKITVATLEQMMKRIAQLEKAILDGNSRVIHKHSGAYEPLKHAGLIRDADDVVQGVWDPTLGYELRFDPQVRAHGDSLIDRFAHRLPESTKELLQKATDARWGDAPALHASSVSWRDVITPRRVLQADGTQILNTTTETIMCPDFTFAADYMEVGDLFKYTVMFDHSTVITTPGTHTFRIRWGGVGGTSLAASGAYAPDPTAASTTVSEMLEFVVVVRSIGTAGSMFSMGRFTPNDFDDASATTLQGNLNMMMIPTSAPAVTSSLDTTTAKSLSPTYTSSVNTATTQVTSHISWLESLN